MKGAYRAIMKLAIDIVKVDRSIHINEIDIVKQLRVEYDLSDNDMKQLNRYSFQEAVKILQKQSKKTRIEAINKLTQVIKADNKIEQKESFLLFAIKMALSDETKDKVQVLSVNPENIDFYGKQIIYLEKTHNIQVNKYIDKNLDYIQTVFNSLNIDFFYIPNILQKAKNNTEFMADIMKYLMPYFSINVDNRVETILAQVDHIVTSSRFEKEILKRLGSTEDIRFETYLLMKVQNSYIVNQSGQRIHKSDFICIDAAIDYLDILLKEILISFFQKEQKNEISFRGYHRILFEILSDETKSDWNLVIKKAVNGTRKFYLQRCNNGEEVFELSFSPLERILYLLFLVYGKLGIKSSWFVCLGSKERFDELHPNEQKQVHLLQENMNLIDQFINRSNNLSVQESFTDSRTLNTKISLIRKAIRQIPDIRNPEDFLISNKLKDKYSTSYEYRNIPLNHARVFIEEKKEMVYLVESSLWKKLSF